MAEETKRPSLWASVSGFLARHRFDVGLVVAVMALTLVSRILTMQPIENGGDPLDYWYFVKQWSHHIDMEKVGWNHHRARLGIHWMVWVVQKLFGENPKFYYVAPIFVSTLVSGLMYVLGLLSVGRSTLGRAAGILGVLLLLEFDPLIWASSQLRPAIFGCMYVLAGAICLSAYVQASTVRARRVCSVLIALFAYGGYLSVETSVFFIPGIVVVMWLAHRSFKDCAIVCGILLAGFAVETVFMRSTGGESRLKAVAWRGIGSKTSSYWIFFERLTTSLGEDAYKLLIYTYFISGPALLILSKNPTARIVAFLPMLFLFFVVMVPRGLSPLRPMLPMRDRYFDLMIPFGIITNVALATLLVRRSFEQLGTVVLKTKTLAETRLGGWCAAQRAPLCIFVTVLLTVGYSSKVWAENAPRRRDTTPFKDSSQMYSILSDAYERGLPIIGDWDMDRGGKSGRSRDLHWAFNGFIRSDLLLENGSLGKYRYDSQTHALNSREVYMPASLDADAVAKYAKANPKCVVRLQARKWGNAGARFVKLSTTKKLPASCKSPR